MKIKRLKTYKKFILFFQNAYGFAPPYKFLLDGSFLAHVLKTDINIREHLKKICDEEVELYMTGCMFKELREAGEPAKDALIASRRLTRVKCTHKGVLEGDECMKVILGDKNKEKYGVCSNDSDLRNFLRDKSRCPLIFLNRGVIVMDAPSDILKQKAKIKEVQNSMSAHDRKFLKTHKAEIKQELMREAQEVYQ